VLLITLRESCKAAANGATLDARSADAVSTPGAPELKREP
jgi:hypothetical protein